MKSNCIILANLKSYPFLPRCKEGYRGLRCDQFVPKTDPILSNPTDELGIEFMESGETYQRQILSIFSIAMGISLLGLACMALYCRNKRQRGKPRAHQTEIRTLRDCSLIASRLMSKSSPRIDYDLQHQKCCKAHGSSLTPGHNIGSNNPKVSSPKQSSSLATAKSCSPAAKQTISNHQPASRWTPPISRAGHYLTGGSKDYIHSYKHLRESTDAALESLRRCNSQTEGNQYSRSFLSTQTEAFAHSRERLTLADVPCTRLDQGTAFPPPSHRACSVPIIPSVQASNPEDRAEDRSTTVLHYKGGASASQPINSETEIGSLANCSQGSHALGNQTKHKSLVTYTTALGPRTESTMAKTVISITVLGSGKERVHQSSNLTKSPGRLEHQQVQSTHKEKEEQGAAVYNSPIRRERDCHLSTELKGLSSFNASKS
ncbi:pro-neuregulin-3, membrane-bound isoform isoform X2 [Tachysurus ichikawai]